MLFVWGIWCKFVWKMYKSKGLMSRCSSACLQTCDLGLITLFGMLVSWWVWLEPQVSPSAFSCPLFIRKGPVLVFWEWNRAVGDLRCLRAAIRFYSSVSVPTQQHYSHSITNETESVRGRKMLSFISVPLSFFCTCFSLCVLHQVLVCVCVFVCSKLLS